jgi:hypothetical protein
LYSTAWADQSGPATSAQHAEQAKQTHIQTNKQTNRQTDEGPSAKQYEQPNDGRRRAGKKQTNEKNAPSTDRGQERHHQAMDEAKPSTDAPTRRQRDRNRRTQPTPVERGIDRGSAESGGGARGADQTGHLQRLHADDGGLVADDLVVDDPKDLLQPLLVPVATPF